MTQWQGRAAITWAPSTADVETERVHRLSVPLRDIQPGFTQQTYTAESLDKTAIQTYTIGTGAHEFVGTARFDDDPQSLLDLIAAGGQGITLNYFPDLADSNVSFACNLVSPRDTNALVVGIDPERGKHFGEGSVTLRLRQTDETRFDGIYRGTDTLFRFRGGGSLADATYARAGTAATYTSKGPGTITTTATGIARVMFFDLDSDTLRESPAILLEDARTNLVTQSEDISTWTDVGTPITTGSQADPEGTSTAYKIEDDEAVSVFEGKFHVPTAFTGNAEKVVSTFVKEGTSDKGAFGLFDNTAATWRHRATITWTDGVPALATETGAGTLFPVEKHRDGWYRVSISATGVLAANTNRFYLYPAFDGGADVGDMHFWGMQAEDAIFPSSYIATSGSTQARVIDDLFWPFNAHPQALTVYLRFIELGSALHSTGNGAVRIFEIGFDTDRIAIIADTSPMYYGQIRAAATSRNTGTLAAVPTRGQLIEHLLTVNASGVVNLSQTVDSAAATSATASTSGALPTSFGETRIYLGTDSGGDSGFAAFLNVAVVRGVQTFARMRQVAGV